MRIYRGSKALKNIGIVLMAAVLTFGSTILPALPAVAAGEGLSSPADKSITIGDTVAITDLQITGEGEDEMTLALSAPNGSFTFGTEAAEVTGSSNNVVLSGSMNEINTTLATLSYTPTEIGNATISADLNSTIAGVQVDPDSGRGYIMVRADDDCEDDCEFTWFQARDAAEDYTYGGASGYLATITSQEENDFIYSQLQENGWIGANDLDQEGEWRWVTGPENGLLFWDGDENAEPLDDVYSNWVTGQEPNGFLTENCALFWDGDGGWNDLDCEEGIESFVVEFGEDEDLPEVVSTQFTVTVNAVVQNIGNCDQLLALDDGNVYDTINLTADIDCQGYEVDPLFDGEEFYGILQGNNHTIRNVTINMPGSYNVGLLYRAVGATIENLTLENVAITAAGTVGALAGYGENVTISNVHVVDLDMQIEWGYSGGLIGELYVDSEAGESSVVGSSVQGTLQAEGSSNIGGLIGYVYVENSKLLIQKTYTDVAITNNNDGGEDIGGLVGELGVYGWNDNQTGEIELRDVYAWGDVIAPDSERVGGLVGRLNAETSMWSENQTAMLAITNAYAKGAVTARNEAGGLIGQMNTTYESEGSSYVVTNSFAMGQVSITGEEQDDYIGGLVGRNGTMADERTFTNNYYDQTRTGQTVCATEDGDGEALSCTAVNGDSSQPNYFINNSTNAPLNTWDFEDTWVKNASTSPTFQQIIDLDSDGISDTVEGAGPNNGDANNDGTPDREQSHVASFVSAETGKYVTLVVSDECSITEISISKESDAAHQDTSYQYNNGLVNFTADCGEAGFTTTVVIYHHGVQKENLVVRKYNPTTGEYFNISSASLAEQTIGGQTATVASYQITDGGSLDIDGEEDGIIKDPVGLAQAVGAAGSPDSLSATGQNTVLLVLISLVVSMLSLTAVFALQKKH